MKSWTSENILSIFFSIFLFGAYLYMNDSFFLLLLAIYLIAIINFEQMKGLELRIQKLEGRKLK